MLVGGYFLASWFANNQATDAITVLWNKAVEEQATFTEVLHGPYISADVATRTCQVTVNWPTNCRYYTTRDVNPHQVCTSHDKHGNCDGWTTEYDTEYDPWFHHERQLSARVNILKRLAESPLKTDSSDYPVMYFSDWIALENWQSDKYWGPGGNFDSQTPPDWARIKNALDRGQVIVGNWYHHYLNWYHADDLTLFREYDGNVPSYKAAGLLPTMPSIYSKSGVPATAYDYDFVQFLGVSVQNQDEWQQRASLFAADAGPNLQASLMLIFAPADKIQNKFEWINTMKAYLMDKSTFKLRILPKNLVLIGCGVSGQTVKFCQMETGMFTGNNEVKLAVSHVADVPFTPDAVIGQIQAGYMPPKDGVQLVKFNEGKGSVLDLLYASPPNGFSRVHMASADYLKTDIQPKPEQIAQIESSQQGSAILWSFLMLIVIGAIEGFVICGESGLIGDSYPFN